VNWLPGLLEPIALNPKVITTPTIDLLKYDTFEYKKLDDGGRGIMNWDLQYRRFPRRIQDRIFPDAPIECPIMVTFSFQHFFFGEEIIISFVTLTRTQFFIKKT
jgi:hypothetical protein